MPAAFKDRNWLRFYDELENASETLHREIAYHNIDKIIDIFDTLFSDDDGISAESDFCDGPVVRICFRSGINKSLKNAFIYHEMTSEEIKEDDGTSSVLIYGIEYVPDREYVINELISIRKIYDYE